MIETEKFLPCLDFAQNIDGGVTAPRGFSASAVYCGVKRASYETNTLTANEILENKTTQAEHRPDLMLICADKPCNTAALFTKSIVKGAPLIVSREHLSDGRAQAIISNSGIANTCCADGVEKARAMCTVTARELGISETDVLVASTGVIGKTLPFDPIRKGIPYLHAKLANTRQAAEAAAKAIMTLDTVKKELAITFELSGKKVTIGAMGKGGGMIRPDMATVLGFITTDAAISNRLLIKSLYAAAADSFNMLSVDGDTSTNDSLFIMASGMAGNDEITEENADYELFSRALSAVCLSLARMIARDGDGATKIIECLVTGAASVKDARKIAKSVIMSPLVKTMIFGEDANCGRILCAVGNAGAKVDIDGIGVVLCSEGGEIETCRAGCGLEFSEEDAKKILSFDAVTIKITLSDGGASARAFGCDLTCDYIKINGAYRSPQTSNI